MNKPKLPQAYLDLYGKPALAMPETGNSCTYTDTSGKVMTVACLDWLEDGHFWDEEEQAYFPCARYCIGDDDGDGLSVWLDADGQEVEV